MFEISSTLNRGKEPEPLKADGFDLVIICPSGMSILSAISSRVLLALLLYLRKYSFRASKADWCKWCEWELDPFLELSEVDRGADFEWDGNDGERGGEGGGDGDGDEDGDGEVDGDDGVGDGVGDGDGDNECDGDGDEGGDRDTEDQLCRSEALGAARTGGIPVLGVVEVVLGIEWRSSSTNSPELITSFTICGKGPVLWIGVGESAGGTNSLVSKRASWGNPRES